jgi:hypothetical protein
MGGRLDGVCKVLARITCRSGTSPEYTGFGDICRLSSADTPEERRCPRISSRTSTNAASSRHDASCCRPSLRQMAYMFAVRSIRQDGIFRAEYDGLYARNGGKGTKARVALMRSALRLMYAAARDRRTFSATLPDAGQLNEVAA